MSDSGFQPLTREAMAKQAAEIAARQAQAAGLPVPEEIVITPVTEVAPPEEVVLTPAPLEVAPPVIAPPIVVPVVKPQPVEETVPVVEEPVKEPEPVPSLTEVEKELAEVELDEDGNPIFKVSSALTGEFTGCLLYTSDAADEC
jgi:hypothetical protein